MDLADQPLPVGAAAEQRRLQPRAQREALPPVGRRRRVDAQQVAPALVAQHGVDRAQLERGRAALLVDPAQPRAAQHQLVLAQQPVGGAGVERCGRAVAEVDPGHMQPALRVAAQLGAGAVDDELVKAQLERRQRPGRQHEAHARQPQHLARTGVEQHDIGQRDRGHPAGGLDLQVADAHRQTQRAAGLLLDLRQPGPRVGQNAPLQRQPRHKH